VITDPSELQERKELARTSQSPSQSSFREIRAEQIPGTGVTAHMEQAHSEMHVDLEQNNQQSGPITVQNKFVLFCGNLEISGATGFYTLQRWGRNADGDMDMDYGVGQADVASMSGASHQLALRTIQDLIGNLEARGLCQP
jgi:hypothetical protein